jgi:hypothetical protein
MYSVTKAITITASLVFLTAGGASASTQLQNKAIDGTGQTIPYSQVAEIGRATLNTPPNIQKYTDKTTSPVYAQSVRDSCPGCNFGD